MQSRDHASDLRTRQDHAHRKPLSGSGILSLSRFRANLSLLMRKWYVIGRSFRGHIRIQFATRTGWVDLAPAFRHVGERYVANERTHARAEGIEKLLAKYRWADSADRRIFLLGFEAGEKFGRDCPECFPDSPE